jgi:hypothetical protein
MATYLFKYLTAVAAILSALVSVSLSAVQTCEDNAMCALAHYRQRQIRTASPPVDTMFVGDSTLGFALDDHRFSELKRGQTINLGTAGFVFGLPSAYSLIEQAVERFHPKNIVIMLTPHTFALSIKELGDAPIKGFVLASGGHHALLFSVNGEISWLVLKQLARLAFDSDSFSHGLQILTLQQAYSTDCAKCVDYFSVLPRDVIDAARVSQSWTHPTHDYEPFLRKISATCKSEAINCIYVHGTLLAKLCDQSAPYIAEITKMVHDAGIQVAQPSPICVPPREIGNSFNHVHPDFREKYTDEIYAVLSPYLQ